MSTTGAYCALIYRACSCPRQPPTNLISGQRYRNANGNYQRAANEQPLAGIPVMAGPGNYCSLSDKTGHFVLAVGADRCQMRALPPPAKWAAVASFPARRPPPGLCSGA